MTTQGVLIVKDQETPFTTETTVQLPNQFRNVIRLQNEHKTVFVNIVDGDKMYFTLDGQPEKVSDTLAAELRETMQLNQAVRLVPLLTDRSYTLEALGEVKVDDQPAWASRRRPRAAGSCACSSTRGLACSSRRNTPSTTAPARRWCRRRCTATSRTRTAIAGR